MKGTKHEKLEEESAIWVEQLHIKFHTAITVCFFRKG
jgi:hypothetical protein